jgi:hypothetical protein
MDRRLIWEAFVTDRELRLSSQQIAADQERAERAALIAKTNDAIDRSRTLLKRIRDSEAAWLAGRPKPP